MNSNVVSARAVPPLLDVEQPSPNVAFPKEKLCQRRWVRSLPAIFALERFPQLSPAFKNALFMGRFQGGTDDQADSG
jgi:hypothetical protein